MSFGGRRVLWTISGEVVCGCGRSILHAEQ
jgi:hypothetical protein